MYRSALSILLLVSSVRANQATDRPETSAVDLCGLGGSARRSNRILNGEPTLTNEFPWTVSFFTYKPPADPTFCTGTLINQRWVLTASGCVKNAKHFSVFLGAYNLSAYEANRMTVYATEYHEEPSSGYLALIRLSTNVTYSDHVRPVCLPAPDEPDHAGETAILSGWGKFSPDGLGYSQVLRKAETTIIPRATCKEIFNRIITDYVICTNSSLGHVICAGDQGSSLTYQMSNGRFVLMGIALFFTTDCRAGQMNGFTRVQSFVQWINQVADNSTVVASISTRNFTPIAFRVLLFILIAVLAE